LSWLQALVLGIVQGVTEFLPISSSAHLILTSELLGWPDQGLAFDMAANTGSLAAVIVCFAGEWRRLLSGALGLPVVDAESRRQLGLLALATVPVALVGLTLQSQVAESARQVGLIAATSIAFGLLLAWADRRRGGIENLAAVGWIAALVIGLAQALALVPGTSRAGVTITAGLLVGLARPTAVRFAFLLAVPVGLLVGAKNVFDLIAVGGEWSPELAIGFVVSGLSAYFAIRWLLHWVRGHNLLGFVAYRVILGLALLTHLVA
jgi:undecaprenyl-diphosphatase